MLFALCGSFTFDDFLQLYVYVCFVSYEKIICKIQLEENTKSKLINDFETKNINLTNLRFLSKKIINKCKVNNITIEKLNVF